MLAANYSNVRANLKDYCDRVVDDNETVSVTWKYEKNVVVISLAEWNELQKRIRNAEYLAGIDRSIADYKAGHVITKTLDELKAMENE